MFLQEFMTQPDLSNYSALVFDDAHEKSVSTDPFLAVVKGLVQRRPELRVLITSAEIDAEEFSQ